MYESAPFLLHTGYDLCLQLLAASCSSDKKLRWPDPYIRLGPQSGFLMLGTCQQPEECTL